LIKMFLDYIRARVLILAVLCVVSYSFSPSRARNNVVSNRVVRSTPKNDNLIYSRQLKLFAINPDNSIKKNRSRKSDVTSLHASAFQEKNSGSQTVGHEYELDPSYSETTEDSSVQDIQSSRLSSVWQARFLLIMSAALYGTNFTFIKIINENMPVLDGTILRFALATLGTLPFMFRQNVNDDSSAAELQKSSSDEDRDMFLLGDLLKSESIYASTILAGFEVGCWNAMGYISQAIGLETTQASTSAFICAMAVVVVPILDFLSGKKILSRQVIAAITALLGVALLELDGNALSEGGFLLSKGDLYSMLQPLAFGMGFWRMEHAIRRYPNEAMKLTAAQLSAVAIISVLFTIITSGMSGLPPIAEITTWAQNPVIVGSIIWTGLITTALTIYMETLALKTLSAAETTMLFSTEPIFGGAFAAVVLGERFGVGGFLGAATILGACLFGNLKTDDSNI